MKNECLHFKSVVFQDEKCKLSDANWCSKFKLLLFTKLQNSLIHISELSFWLAGKAKGSGQKIRQQSEKW